MKSPNLILLLVMLVSSISLSGCVDQSQQTGKTIEIKNFSVQPDSITVPVGTIVTWINRDPASHTITSDDGKFDSGTIKSGGEFRFTFSQPGTYTYHCAIHPSMIGKVVVTPVQVNPAKINETNTSATQPITIKTNAVSTAKVGLELVAEGFTAPMEFVSPGDGTGRMFLVDQIGMIKIILANGTMIREPFLDVSDRMVKLGQGYDERGLLGLAFHPDFAKNGRIFVLYSAPLRAGAPKDFNCTTHVSEFVISKGNPNKVNMSSERIILQVDKPYMNHNGGTIAFGPDGYLYIPLGDGGGANDVGVGHTPKTGNAQNTSTVLGKVLRIDVNNMSKGMSYGIPSDNPFVGKEGYLPEIWAYGLRNPYRMSFDKSGNHSLYLSDAGQNLWEEVDMITKGGNYGWNIKEGAHCFDPNNPNTSPVSCLDKGYNGEPLVDPIIDYDGHRINRTVAVGGYIYSGKALPAFEGDYIFGDWSSSFTRGDGTLLIAMPAAAGMLWKIEEVKIAGNSSGRVNVFVRSFGQDDQGELYVLTSNASGPKGETGKVYKIVPAPA
jgi:glucose/arabinose dehydrogenase/plastocyanin